MIISRKKFEEELSKARNEVEERFWINQRLDNMERSLNRSYDGLEFRIRKIEKKIDAEKNVKAVVCHE